MINGNSLLSVRFWCALATGFPLSRSSWHDCQPPMILPDRARLSPVESVSGSSAWKIGVFSHYGLRYGSAPATGDFQRLRGRPPLVSPLKSCMGRSFTAVTRVQIASGTPNLFRSLRGTATFGAGTKRHNSVANFLTRFAQSRVFSGIRSCSCRHNKAHAIQPDQSAATAGARNRRMTLL